MTADVIAMQAEADGIGRRRSDAIKQPSSSSCPPHAALLHRVASLLTTEDLPPAAKVTVTSAGEVLVDLTGTDLVENGVRRYAAALGLIVTESPLDVRGMAATQWVASGFDGHGVGVGTWWHISGHVLQPTPMTDRFGVGIGPSS